MNLSNADVARLQAAGATIGPAAVVPGIVAPPRATGKARGKAKPRKPEPFALFALLAAHGIPAPTPEYRFHPERKWRFDFAWPDKLLALEIEGGVFTGGRHSRGAGMLADMEKYNAAAILGWRVLRCVPRQLSGEAITTIKAAMDSMPGV